MLQTGGYQVLTAGTCSQGMMVFSSHQPDLVVLDLGLPDMDGEELLRKIRQSSTVPVIVLSARTDERDKISALDLGANDYITKPFGPGEMLAASPWAIWRSTMTGGRCLWMLPRCI